MAIYRGPGGSGDATTDAANQASVATAKAAEATTSANAAASSATSADNSATASSTSASNSETSKIAAVAAQAAAELAETNAETAQAAAEAALDSFDDRYLGAKASDPTLDNDGNALIAGALYFNTTTEVMMTYTGSIWQTITTGSGGLQAANNLSDVTNAGTSRTNLGLAIGSDVQAFSSVLAGTTASYTTAEETKLAGIETGATADQTGAEIKTAYEAETNAFTDAQFTKLAGIETAATADQTAGEIKTAYESNADTNAFTDADHTKLDGIEASADVTDTANVTSAGALMDSELTSEASVKALDQGVATTDSPSFAGLTVDTNTLAVDSTNNRVGIGITSPIANLHVQHDSSNSGSIRVTNNTTGSTYSDGLLVGYDTSNDSVIVNHEATNLKFYTNAAETMRIDSNGNVGIGTTNPAATVDVSGNARGAVTTDNDLSFDLSAGNNFSCTPTGGGTLTFTNHLAGQSGFVWLDNSGGHAIAAAGTTKINAADLTAISTAGVYTLAYFDNGTNAYVSVSRSFA